MTPTSDLDKATLKRYGDDASRLRRRPGADAEDVAALEERLATARRLAADRPARDAVYQSGVEAISSTSVGRPRSFRRIEHHHRYVSPAFDTVLVRTPFEYQAGRKPRRVDARLERNRLILSGASKTGTGRTRRTP